MGGESFYENYLRENVVLPKSSPEEFSLCVSNSINLFESGNLVLSKINSGEFDLNSYHLLLTRIFHQVRMSSSSFALAASVLDSNQMLLKDYLLHHAEEERSHWTWILSDLRGSGFKGRDPREEYPHYKTDAYLSYGVYLALKFPVGRLAMAAVLEGISAKFGSEYGKKCAQNMKLDKAQVQFFLSHGELDVDHTEDIFNVLKEANVTAEGWGRMCAVATNTAMLYKEIYNSIYESS